ncbi:MAG: hypothetical protein WA775_03025 [Psychroserpens sp.]|uniref:hypothetical protein n=1 Tax=Psychroserpens sp. TaxID=2020870 RepID=UPI003C829095
MTKDTSVSELKQKSVTTFRDTLLFTPASMTELKIPIALDKKCRENTNTVFVPKTYTQKNGNATASVRIERDTIIVSAKCDSLQLRAQIKHELEQEKYTVEIEKQAKEKIEKVYTFKYIVMIAMSFFAGLGVGVVIIKLNII